MDIIIASSLGFIFGLFSHIIYGVINDSRIKESTKKAIKQEVQANYFQIRDGKNYSNEKTEELGKINSGQPVIVMNYNFTTKSFEDNLSNLPKLGDISLKVHQFYSRLKVLQSTACVLSKLFNESEEIEKKETPETVKALDKNSLNSSFDTYSSGRIKMNKKLSLGAFLILFAIFPLSAMADTVGSFTYLEGRIEIKL